jgi:hypothetical protein
MHTIFKANKLCTSAVIYNRLVKDFKTSFLTIFQAFGQSASCD